jgi:hypothetical protein
MAGFIIRCGHFVMPVNNLQPYSYTDKAVEAAHESTDNPSLL